MTTLHEAAQQALEALNKRIGRHYDLAEDASIGDAIEAPKALAQQGEPDEFGTKAFKDYLTECDECCVEPDVAGAFNGGYQRGKEALAQQGEQQPVGWVDDGGIVFWRDGVPPDGVDLYAGAAPATQPPQNHVWCLGSKTVTMCFWNEEAARKAQAGFPASMHFELYRVGLLDAAPAAQLLTPEQIEAAYICHKAGRVSVAMVQRKMRTSYNYAQKLVTEIVAAHLVDGLEVAGLPNSAHGIGADK